ncbi:unnamed protein product, partial [Prorocentrum cordatum]
EQLMRLFTGQGPPQQGLAEAWRTGGDPWTAQSGTPGKMSFPSASWLGQAVPADADWEEPVEMVEDDIESASASAIACAKRSEAEGSVADWLGGERFNDDREVFLAR